MVQNIGRDAPRVTSFRPESALVDPLHRRPGRNGERGRHIIAAGVTLCRVGDELARELLSLLVDSYHRGRSAEFAIGCGRDGEDGAQPLSHPALSGVGPRPKPPGVRVLHRVGIAVNPYQPSGNRRARRATPVRLRDSGVERLPAGGVGNRPSWRGCARVVLPCRYGVALGPTLSRRTQRPPLG